MSEKPTKALWDDLNDGKPIDPVETINESILQQNRFEIENDMINKFGSREKACKEVMITSAQISNFINGKKGLGRDSQIRLYLTLGYSVDKTRTLLKRFDARDLYPRDTRDLIIIDALKHHWSIDELNSSLEEEGLDTIWPKNY